MTIYGERNMTKRKQFPIGLAVMLLFLSVLFLAGCTKKYPSRSETWIHPEQKPMVQTPAKAGMVDKEAKESALREVTLGDQAVKEEMLGDQAVKGKSSGSAKKDSAGNEVAILKELQIPDIHFDFNEYKLNAENQAILRASARAYLKFTSYKLSIEGHCDERGTVEYNLALGQKRADEAARFLMDLGVARDRIRTIIYGKEKPLDPGHNETAWAKNRRNHFVVSPPLK